MSRLWFAGMGLAGMAALFVACFTEPPLLQPESEPGEGGAVAEGGASPRPVCDEDVQDGCVRVVRPHAGETFTCAAIEDGTLRCFGYNDSGQLGDPTLPLSASDRGVVANLVVDEATVLALGHRHGCALSEGTVRCWGRNQLGQLGTGDDEFALEPVEVMSDVQVLDAYGDTTCAVRDGAVFCWGRAHDGQPWTGLDEGTFDASPTPVPLPFSVSVIALGTLHTCALDTSRSQLWCWGRDMAVGRSDWETNPAPAQVAPTLRTPVHRLLAAGSSTCVLAGEPATVQCWGFLPDGNAPAFEPTDLPVPPDGEVVDLVVGWVHACVLLADGRVQCWGRDRESALGSPGGATTMPRTVVGIEDATALAVGRSQSCAMTTDHAMWCWGANEWGQLGDGTTTGSAVPVRVRWP